MKAPMRSAVIADVQARLPELTRSTVAGVQDAIPAYRDLRADQLHDVNAITSWVLMRVLEAWAHRTGFDDADRARFRAIGAARAHDGRPISSVLRAYRVAAISAAREVRVIGGARLDLDDLADMNTVLLTALDELSEALIAGHAAALDGLNGDRDRARRYLFDDLLMSRQSSAAVLTERSRELDVTIPSHPVLVVAEPIDPAVSIWHPAVESLIDEAFPGSPADARRARDHLVSLRDHRAVLLLPPIAHRELDRVFVARRWHGCLINCSRTDDVAGAYRLAASALDTAPDNAFQGRSILEEGDAQLLALLTAQPAADPAAVVRTVLGPLAEPRHQHLLDGLAAFLATGSATAAAAQLNLHPQTLRYRIRRAHDLTGRDSHLPWHRLALDIARQLQQIHSLDQRARPERQ